MKDFNESNNRPVNFDRCETGNNTQELKDLAQSAKVGSITPFDPAAEVAHLRQLAYEAFHTELQEPRNELSNEVHALRDYTRYEQQVLQKLSEPDVTSKLPVGKVEFNAIGGTISIGFEPGCLDFSANKTDVKVQVSNPYQ